MKLSIFSFASIILISFSLIPVSDPMNTDDILNIAMTGMLSVEHDLHQVYNDPGPLPSINTVFDANKTMY